jgi:hypothetical protein
MHCRDRIDRSNDAIESGLVKTPRVVIRDDGKLAKKMKSRFYHIYDDPEVKADISRSTEPHEPLPDLVTNAYYYLGLDWLETDRSSVRRCGSWSSSWSPVVGVCGIKL